MSEISQKLRKLASMPPRAAAARLTADGNDLILRAADEIDRLEDEAAKQTRRTASEPSRPRKTEAVSLEARPDRTDYAARKDDDNEA